MSSTGKKITNWLLCEPPPAAKRNFEEPSYPSSKKLKNIEDKELTRSPVSGTYIIKNWNVRSKESLSFSKNEVALNSIAASFVEITPQARARLERIPNRIGPFECKLCKVVYKDAFELAMHNCPRVVHIEYKCSECDKAFNCPANLASHKRWHRPKSQKTSPPVGENFKEQANPIVAKPIPSQPAPGFGQDFYFGFGGVRPDASLAAAPVATSPFYQSFFMSQFGRSPYETAESKWLSQLYSSYFSLASQNFFSAGLPFGLPMPSFGIRNEQLGTLPTTVMPSQFSPFSNLR